MRSRALPGFENRFYDFGNSSPDNFGDVTLTSCTPEKGELMENDATVGWIAAIIIGGIAGWLAEQFMKSNMGMLLNIVLGIVGAVVANFILSVFGINLGGWLGYLIAGFIGACILIAIGRMFRRAT